MSLAGRELILGVTGSISAYKAVYLLRERRSDAEHEIARRLARAREEIVLWRRYDYLIVNRDVKEALDQLESIILAERCRTARIDLTLPDLEVQT